MSRSNVLGYAMCETLDNLLADVIDRINHNDHSDEDVKLFKKIRKKCLELAAILDPEDWEEAP